MFNSNDPVSPKVEIPVSMYLNQAPYIKNSDVIVNVFERATETVLLTIVEPENEAIASLEIISIPGFASATVDTDKTTITLTVSPNTGDTGAWEAVFKVTDEFNASTQEVITINVFPLNRAPELMEEVSFAFSLMEEGGNYDMNYYFADPDGDELTITATPAVDYIVAVYHFNNTLRIEPLSPGTTTITLTATDTHGASTSYDATVTITDCIDPEGLIVQKWNSVLIVNDPSQKYVSFQWYKDGNPITGATDQVYVAGGNGSEDLDLNALYHVVMFTADGNKEYSCYYSPSSEQASLRAYPSMVRAGEMVTTSAIGYASSNSPIRIQVINITGQIVKTMETVEEISYINMPTETGVYIIKASNNEIEKTFNVIVK